MTSSWDSDRLSRSSFILDICLIAQHAMLGFDRTALQILGSKHMKRSNMAKCYSSIRAVFFFVVLKGLRLKKLPHCDCSVQLPLPPCGQCVMSIDMVRSRYHELFLSEMTKKLLYSFYSTDVFKDYCLKSILLFFFFFISFYIFLYSQPSNTMVSRQINRVIRPTDVPDTGAEKCCFVLKRQRCKDAKRNRQQKVCIWLFLCFLFF